MVDFNPAFANAGPKREPTSDEITNGFPCGPADRELFNWLINATQSEIDAVISKSGLTASNADLTQLAQAIRAQLLNYRVAGGTANALTVTLDPAPATNAAMTGMPLRVVPASANTDAATLSANGLTALPVVRQDGSPLIAGDLPSGRIVELVCTGTAWQMIGVAASSAGRLINIQRFTASGTYTPTPGMTFCMVEGCGGGGAGGGGSNPTAGNSSLGAPGGGATSGRARFTAADIGASKAVVIGAAGLGALSTTGGTGGSTSLGSLAIFPGGDGGGISNNTAPPAFNGNGSLAGAATGANISEKRGSTPGYATAVSALAIGMYVGPGGDTPYGNGRANSSNSNGLPGIGYGSGGSGVALAAGGGPAIGGNGAAGILIILEYGA